MNDLISRNEVNDVIDELEKYICGKSNTTKVEISVLQLKRFINKLKNIPTAYDINKIIGELRRMSGNGYRDVEGDYVPPMIETKNAIEIVEAGVKNEN